MTDASTDIELIWGINAIAKLIGRTDRQAFHMASTGQIPARKIGGRWCAERGELVAFFKGKAA
ncbi:DNA-binding protein [Brucella sp. 2280]|uniref:DNA-binding protein n=1 Tax=Brucella sp. 2280 TaxID=2592625 RepID=UPI0012951E45|nr:DNA-binding protein [Brucella sp. 2280]QGA57244.1 DNA-binding protein [Brucella sp. 2280]